MRRPGGLSTIQGRFLAFASDAFVQSALKWRGWGQGVVLIQTYENFVMVKKKTKKNLFLSLLSLLTYFSLAKFSVYKHNNTKWSQTFHKRRLKWESEEKFRTDHTCYSEGFVSRSSSTPSSSFLSLSPSLPARSSAIFSRATD